MAAVDSQHQIIVAAQAHGSGSEQGALLPMVHSTDALRTDQTLITADTGYHSESNLKQLHDGQIPALIADGLMRRRDERFKDRGKYKTLPDPLADKSKTTTELEEAKSTKRFTPKYFNHDPQANTCVCPADKALYSNGSQCMANGRMHHKFTGAQRDCGPCDLRHRCLRYPERTPVRQVAFFHKNRASPLVFTERMKQAIDSPLGRKLYGQRMAVVEPVFGNLRYNKRLDRFTL